jgi:hypothetical protein
LIKGCQEIDATLGKYKLRRRISSADAILPHADEQYKYSEALQSGYSIRFIKMKQENLVQTLRGNRFTFNAMIYSNFLVVFNIISYLVLFIKIVLNFNEMIRGDIIKS